MTTLQPPKNQGLSPDQADPNPVELYLNSLTSPHSKRMMRRALQRIVEAMGGTFDAVQAGAAWASLVQKRGENFDVSRLSAVRAELAKTHKPSTANQSLVALRQVLRECWRAGLIDSAGYALAADTLAGIKDANAGRVLTGRDIELGEASAVFAACKGSREDPRPAACAIRDVALFALFFAGMRRAEVAGARLADWDDKTAQLTVTGKGRKTRLVPFDRAGANAIRDWITLRGEQPGALLLPVRKNGAVIRDLDAHGELKGMTPQAVYMVNKRRTAVAGVNELTPHDWRRTATGDYLDAGVDVVIVAEIMGWSDPKLAARYDRRGERARLDAASRRVTPVGR